MRCPACESGISWRWLEFEGVEPNTVFACPSCGESLRFSIDEGTYFGATHQTIEIVDDAE